MASVSSQEQDSFSCSVCFELLWDPVTIPCGHICCAGCIESCWDQKDVKGEYSCPLCKHTFDSRPVLHKNSLMAEMVKKFGKTKIQAAAAAHCYAEPGDVACDICILSRRELKAVKSCLDCVMSFCYSHLKAHNELIGVNHTKIDATGQLHEKNMVPMAGDPCSDVAQSVFNQSHFSEPLEEEPDFISRQEIVTISAAATNEQISPDMESDKTDDQAPTAEPVAREDFLQDTDPEPPVRREDMTREDPGGLEPVTREDPGGLEPVTREDPGGLETVTREDFLKYSCYFTLDPNTAHSCLRLSEGSRVVLGAWWPGGGRGLQPRPEEQAPPDHPDRFDGQWYQVLCREGVYADYARCYWEVEWSGWVGIAVSYKSISRKGDGHECGFGSNRKSWSLDVGSGPFLWHNNGQKRLNVAASSRIGVSFGCSHRSPRLLEKMAEARAGNMDILECPICFYLLNDPVALTCGHSYCLRCIENCWDKGVYSCPECSQTFAQRPVLNKNIILAELADQKKKSRIQTASSECAAAGPGEVECDICTGRKLKAVKSCLECLKSYCETHLKTHDELHSKNHTVIDATGQLQEWICPRHNKVVDIFCRTDQSCICYLCMVDYHKGHDTISATTEWSHKKEELGQSQKRCHQIIQLKEKELQELRKAVETLKSDAQTAVKESERMFTEMIRSIEKRCLEVTELIKAQEKAEVSRAEGLLKRLEQEIAELKQTDAEMKQLALTQDPIQFLKVDIILIVNNK
ncbi:E3 ubiquitin-protein ligase TRIM7-like [Engraulis encrasicolus]|uniref:E3 ubiquitin-protein ligase TRIM7-like n=1 Tax=Engraulis encrasicolus TaxID=184585 RepID=UPI002FD5FA7A